MDNVTDREGLMGLQKVLGVKDSDFAKQLGLTRQGYLKIVKGTTHSISRKTLTKANELRQAWENQQPRERKEPELHFKTRMEETIIYQFRLLSERAKVEFLENLYKGGVKDRSSRLYDRYD